MLSTDRSPPARRRSRSRLRTVFAALLLSAGCTEVGTNTTPESPPDFAIEAKYTTDGPLDDLSTVSFQVGVRNLGGNAPAASFVSMYIDSVYVKGVPLGNLAPGVTTTLTFDWRAKPGAHAIRFEIRRVAPDAVSGAESDQANNVAALSLTVPVRQRRIVARTWGPSAEILASARGDARVREVIAVAADSGFEIPSGARTLETRYDGEGMSTLVTPMGPPDAPANSAPLLVVVQFPVEGHGTVMIPYLFRLIDGTSYTVYNGNGGSRVSRIGGSTKVVPYPPASKGPQADVMATGACVEDDSVCEAAAEASSRCLKLGEMENKTLEEEAAWLMICGGALVLLQQCSDASVDNPPVITPAQGTNGSGECAHCLGTTTTLLKWTNYGWAATATDDRGFTWNSSSIFAATCDGGSYTFSVTDCGGQTATVTVNAIRHDFPSVPNWQGCEDQGKGKNKSASLLFPGSSAPLLSAKSPWRACDRLPSRFEDDQGVEHAV
jgi:rRNA maturation protein Nop10